MQVFFFLQQMHPLRQPAPSNFLGVNHHHRPSDCLLQRKRRKNEIREEERKIEEHRFFRSIEKLLPHFVNHVGGFDVQPFDY